MWKASSTSTTVHDSMETHRDAGVTSRELGGWERDRDGHEGTDGEENK